MWVMRELRKLATIMKGSRTIRQVHANSTVKSALLAFIVSLIVTLVLFCNAFATELPADDYSLEANDCEALPSQTLLEKTMDRDLRAASESDFEATPETVPEDETPLPDTGFGAVADSFDVSQDVHSSGFEASASSDQVQETPDQSNYVSVRGYSAFNHFSLAVKAMVAAIAIVGICFAAYFMYRRYKRDKED